MGCYEIGRILAVFRIVDKNRREIGNVDNSADCQDLNPIFSWAAISRREWLMLRYKAGFKFVENGVHAQVLDFPAAITWGPDLAEARRALAVALVDVAEAAVESGQPLPVPDPKVFDPEMEIEEPIYLLFRASSAVREVPTGVVS